MTAPGLTIRTATADDLPAVAALHVKSWQQAYAGQIDQSYLDSLDVAARLDMWQQLLARTEDPRFGLFVALKEDCLIGFISYVPPDSADGDIRIGALYLLQEVWSQGIGHQLFTQALKAFRTAGFKRPYLWVLDTNSRALQAYRRWGGKVDENRVKEARMGTQKVREFCITFALD